MKKPDRFYKGSWVVGLKPVSKKPPIVIVSYGRIVAAPCPNGHTFCLSPRCWVKAIC